MRLSLVLSASLLLLAVPAAAQAATVARTPTQLTFAAGAAEANHVTVVPSGANYVVTDTGVGALVDGDGAGGCAVAGNQATCPASGVTRVSVTAADGNDTVNVDAVTADLLEGGTGLDTLSGGPGDDTIVGGDGNDVLNGEGGNDVLNGEGGNDVHNGDGGNDTMRGRSGADVYNGNAGTDVASYSDSTVAETVTVDNVANDGSADDEVAGKRDNVRTDVENFRGGAAGDRYTGNGVGNVIEGLGGGDSLNGGGGNDVFHGGDGNDTMRGQTGADIYNGNAGTDVASYSDSVQGEVVDLDGLADDGSADDGPAGARDNVRTDVEQLRGGKLGDVLIGNGGPNRLEGMDGGDHLQAEGGNDVVLGGNHRDLLYEGAASNGADLLDGQGGANDIAYYAHRSVALAVSIDDVANDGEDTVPGGAAEEGDNVRTATEDVTGGSANDLLTGSSVDNVLDGYIGGDQLSGLSGADSLYGNDGPDQVSGGPGNDIIQGGYGADTESGGDDDDTFVAVSCGDCGDGGDDVSGGNGTDTLDFQSRNLGLYVTLDDAVGDGQDANHDLDSEEDDNYHSDVEDIIGTPDTDILRGSGAANEFTGGDAIDNFVTGAGNDVLRGDGGNDYLDGGADNDQVLGGDGDDYIDQGSSADGADDLQGGTGAGDVVNYGWRTASRISVSLDNNANDGEFITPPAEGDNVHADFEIINGGQAGNNFFGSSASETFYGSPARDGGFLGAGNDVFFGYDDVDEIFGEAGNDQLTGGDATDFLQGGDDNDTINGEGGNDSIAGGPGNDSENGGAGDDLFSQGGVASGADDLNCGTGSESLGDRVQYTNGTNILDGRLVPVYVSPDNVANDGENSDGNTSNGGEEADNLHSDCEDIWGGKAGDYFWGSAGNDTFVGMQGNDTLVGNDGNDYLDGRQGDDLLFAIDPSGPAADQVYGGTGEEVSGDAGQWNSGVDSVFEMEDTNPG